MRSKKKCSSTLKTLSSKAFSKKTLEKENKWHERNLAIAKLLASYSKDPSTKCGCYICTLNNTPISNGFNGFAQKVKDKKIRLNNRDIKLQLTLHAEENALAFSPTNDLSNCKVYTWPLPPCAKCASQLIQRRINTVVVPRSLPERWRDSCNLALEIFKESGTKVILL